MRIKSGCQQVDTHAFINGVEQEVLVHYFVQPAEDDTNTPFGIELESVIFEDEGDVLGEMSEVEQERLVASILESYEWSE